MNEQLQQLRNMTPTRLVPAVQRLMAGNPERRSEILRWLREQAPEAYALWLASTASHLPTG